MKRILLLTAVLLTAVLHVCAEKTAQALWCEDNTTLYLTYDETVYAAGDTYNGQTITTVSTDFKQMGRTAAEMILDRSPRKVHNPFGMIRRNTF